MNVTLRCKDDKAADVGSLIKVHYYDLFERESIEVGVLEWGDLGFVLDFPHYGQLISLYEFYTDEPEDFELVGHEDDYSYDGEWWENDAWKKLI